jgi:hypothetical protein
MRIREAQKYADPDAYPYPQHWYFINVVDLHWFQCVSRFVSGYPDSDPDPGSQTNANLDPGHT